ncbi:hypothetical protein ABIB38_001783 [Massilia sp. UYP11]|uniref:hypothetical protein n=1 Tax=Massilia sp. UYP11 TaxID=1756385 RepID=UPI003D1EC753
MKRITVMLLVMGALSACSGQPSDSEMKEALQKTADQTMEAIVGKNANQSSRIVYNSVKSAGCKSDGEKAYRCDVEVETDSMLGKQKTVMPVRFVKTGDGWMPSQ